MSSLADRSIMRAIPRGIPGGAGPPPIPAWSDDVLLYFKDANGDPLSDPVNLLGPEGPAGDFQSFETRTRAAAAVIMPILRWIRIARFADGYPLTPAIYIPGTSAGPMAFQEANGNWWELDLTGQVMYAAWFGTKPDGRETIKTDNLTALQAFLTELAARGGIGRVGLGAHYVSGALQFRIADGIASAWIDGWGATIVSNTVTGHFTLEIKHIPPSSRLSEARRVLVTGLTIDHLNNPAALAGFVVTGSPRVVFDGCASICGSDSAAVPAGNYASWYFRQSNDADSTTGSIECTIMNCTGHNGAVPAQFGILSEGANNGLGIFGNALTSYSVAIRLTRARPADNGQSAEVNAQYAVVANGVSITRLNRFEGNVVDVDVTGNAGYSSLQQFEFSGNRVESTAIVCFRYSLTEIGLSSVNPPVIGPNELSSTVSGAKYISNPNNLPIIVRDRFIGHATLNSATVNANSSTTLNDIPVLFSREGDVVMDLRASSNLGGCQLRGFVSADGFVRPVLDNFSNGNITVQAGMIYVEVMPNAYRGS